MKRFSKIGIAALLSAAALLMSGCDFLDVSPDMGLTDEEVFSYYDNTWAYFSQMYVSGVTANRWDYRECWPLFMNVCTGKFNFDAWTPSAVTGRDGDATKPRRGCMLASYPDLHLSNNTASNSPVLMAMLKIIRICNITMENIDRLTDAKEEEVQDLLGQAYFMRGLAHFCLARLFGGWPYIDHSLKAEDEWDLARLPLYDTYRLAAEDMYTAYEYFRDCGKMRRDTYPGTPGHLVVNDEFIKPNGVAALAFRGRMLLYAASPLANPSGNPEYWKDAAEASALALKVALEEQYALQPMEKWRENFVEVTATNENIWQHTINNTDKSNSFSWLFYAQNNQTGSAGLSPTQNYVDKFETIWGEALNTEEDRAAATAAGHYNETGDPYSNRDPRLEMTILHDGSKTKYGVVCNMYKDKKGNWPTTTLTSSAKRAMAYEWGEQLALSNGFSRTGYGAHKYWRGNGTNSAYPHLDAFRLAEIYLNYAEAANEYGGPSAKVGESDLTAEEAVNVIRARMGMPGVASKYTTDKVSFRSRIHNERQVEFAYEGNHNYFDLRRWVDDAKKEYNEKLYGMYVTEVTKDANHPHSRNYERRILGDTYQTVYGWQDYMFYIPIPAADALKMKNFVNAEFWPVQ